MMDVDTPATAPARSPLPRRLWEAPSLRARKTKPSIQLLSASALLVPLTAIGAWSYHAAQSGGVTLADLFLGPLLGGSALIFWILFLHLVVCRDGLDALGIGGARGWMEILREIAWGLALAAALLAFHAAFTATAARLFAPQPPAPQVLELLSGVVRDPLLLAVWLGPVVWIGVALFEELARVFLLRRFWGIWFGAVGRWGGILAVSALVGLAHAYQGPGAVLSIAVESVLLGGVFLRRRRIGALIISHALYDSAQVIQAVVAIRQMGG